MPTPLAGAAPFGGQDGGRRRGASVKTLKRMLKKAGLKVSGKKATLTRRAKKAHLKMRGGDDPVITASEDEMEEVEGGRRRRRGSRKSRRGGVQCPHGMVDYRDGKGCVRM